MGRVGQVFARVEGGGAGRRGVVHDGKPVRQYGKIHRVGPNLGQFSFQVAFQSNIHAAA
jgi:hypothetical protein